MNPSRGRAADNQKALQEAIKRLIVERGLAPGELLPTEPELMEELSVSRHPLREAVKALQALGIVEVRHGLGTYVGTASMGPLQAGLSFHSGLSLSSGDLRQIRDLVQTREVLETGLVRQVMAHAGRADLVILDTAVSTMESEAAAGRFSPEADWMFHKTMYAPVGNELITDLLRVFWSVFNEINPLLPRTTQTPAYVAGQHRAILEALRRSDEAGLTAAVVDHFTGINGRIAEAAARQG